METAAVGKGEGTLVASDVTKCCSPIEEKAKVLGGGRGRIDSIPSKLFCNQDDLKYRMNCIRSILRIG